MFEHQNTSTYNVKISYSEEASYAEAKYQLSYNQYLIQIIVVISYALYCGVPVFKYFHSFFAASIFHSRKIRRTACHRGFFSIQFEYSNVVSLCSYVRFQLISEIFFNIDLAPETERPLFSLATVLLSRQKFLIIPLSNKPLKYSIQDVTKCFLHLFS